MEVILLGKMLVKQIINHVYYSNTFILYSEKYKEAWIIDIGDTDKILDWIDTHDKIIKGVLLTHTHFDHIYGLNELLLYDPNIPVFTSFEGKEGVYSDKLNFSKYHNTSFVFKGSNIVCVGEEDVIPLWPGINAIVLKTPGHDWSCLSYEIGDVLFTGDAYIPGLKVITSFPKSNKQEAINSEQRIISRNHIRTIYPGHGNIFIKSYNNNE